MLFHLGLNDKGKCCDPFGAVTIFFSSIFLIASLLLAGCGKPVSTPAKGGPRVPVYEVGVVEIHSEPFDATLAATGTLLANEFVEIQSERTGLVTDIPFKEGQPVLAGTVLVKIDDSELRAEFARIEAELTLAQATEERQRSLLNQRNIAKAVHDESLANLNIARARSELIKAQLTKSEIRAPFDGTPGLREISVGSFLTAGSRVTTFQDISSLKVDFSVPERYRSLLAPGQTISLRVAGMRDPREGKIYAIEPGIDVNTRSVLLRAKVMNPDGALQPGQFAEIEIALESIPDNIMIPGIALIPGLKRQRVLLYQNGVVEEREVETGIRTVGSVQILDGLEDGDQLITTGILQLRPGMEVKPLEGGAPTATPLAD